MKLRGILVPAILAVAVGVLGGSSVWPGHTAEAQAQVPGAGSLDTTFGTGGKVTTDFGVETLRAHRDSASAMALQPDGKIVAAGYSRQRSGSQIDDFPALVRYNADGSLDTTFGGDGKVISFRGRGAVNAMALQSDGKIVAVGSSDQWGSWDFALERYNTDGSPDTSFGNEGRVITDFGLYSGDGASAVALQSDGKIVAAGYTRVSGSSFAVARYNADGSLDTSFGTGGKVTTTFSGGDVSDLAMAVALQADGKIVAVGSHWNGRYNYLALVRYNAAGSLDTTFGSGGKVISFRGTGSVNAMALQADGKIVAAIDSALVRYNANGSLDATFGVNGKAISFRGTGSVNAIALQSDGKIVAAGTSGRDFALACYHADGALDTTFGTDGKVTTDIGFDSNDGASAVALQSDGKIVAAGESYDSNGNSSFALVRYHGGTTDREILEVFYNATGGGDWTDNTNWLSDKPLGEWHGVRTDANGRVVGLHFEANQLSGEIPSELGSLYKLEELYIYSQPSGGNRLSGEIPPELGSLSNLKRLVLEFNDLSGPIPAELGSLSNLTNLLLTGNQLSGEIPPELGSLSNLTSLSLTGNQLSGEIPSELGSLSSLVYLNLYGNQLSGEIPSELGSLSNLTTLSLSANQLSGEIPPELGSLSKLTTLMLYHNSALFGPLPGSLTSLDLTQLWLQGTELCAPTDDALQTWLGGVEDKRGVANCGDRHILAVLYNTTGGDEWTNNTNWLSHNYYVTLGEWHGVTTDSEGRVTKLVLGENRLVGTIPTETGGLSALTELQLGGNHLSGQIPTELGGLSALERLNLEDNDLSGPIPAGLGGLSELTHLLLGGNNLSGSLPAALGDLGKLTQLGVGDNDLSGPIPSRLGSLGKLELLDLHRNDLSGSIPSELGSLANLESLDLNDNDLSGSIPSELGSLSNLEYLNLNDNDLSGPIPAELGNLSNLSQLLLSGNDLTGEIPASLVDLAELEVLHLHRNQMSGCVPGGLVHPGLDLRTDLSCIDYDSDDDGLIEVSTLAQLDAIRWDPDGDGSAGDAGYAAAFPNANSGAVKDYSELIAKVREWRNDPDRVDNEGHTDRWDRVLLALGETVADTSLTPMTATEAQGYADRGWERWVEVAEALREIEGAGMGCPSGGCTGYELTRDLDFDNDSSGKADIGDAYWNGGAGWTPIGLGEDDGFAAVFEGNGHAIRNLYVKTSGDRAGLFSLLAAGSEVRNVGLESVNVSGRGEVGGLVGLSNGTVSGIHVTGTVSGRNAVGGLAGVSGGTGVIEGSYAAADVTGTTPRSSGGRDVGGLVGYHYGAVRASYATGAVSGKANNTGGLAGLSEGGSSIVASYAASTVSTSGRYAGGLVGSSWGDITASYSSGKVSAGGGNAGGLVGHRGRGTVTFSYWDTQSSGLAGSPAGQGKTTAQLKQPTGYTGIYADWNVDTDGDGNADDPWDFGTASEYPMLK